MVNVSKDKVVYQRNSYQQTKVYCIYQKKNLIVMEVQH